MGATKSSMSPSARSSPWLRANHHIPTITPSSPPWNDMPPSQCGTSHSGSASRWSKAVEQRVASLPPTTTPIAPHRIRSSTCSGVSGAPGRARAAGQPPGGGERGEVHQSVPVDFSRAPARWATGSKLGDAASQRAPMGGPERSGARPRARPARRPDAPVPAESYYAAPLPHGNSKPRCA